MKRRFFRTSVLNFMAALAFLGTGNLWGTFIEPRTNPYNTNHNLNINTTLVCDYPSLVMAQGINFNTDITLTVSPYNNNGTVIFQGQITGSSTKGTLTMTSPGTIILDSASTGQAIIKKLSLSGGATFISEHLNNTSTTTLLATTEFALNGGRPVLK